MIRSLLGILLVVVLVILPISNSYAEVRGIKVVTTFQHLADDVKKLLCEGDEVYSLVPPGIDPHDYSLTPKDVDLLKHADLIISTAHTSFEAKISEMIGEGELRAKLIEIPKIENISLRYIAGTNTINYHEITYDINNYLTFMYAVSEELGILRSECRSTYLENLKKVANNVERLRGLIDNINLIAVGSSPLTQYAVEYLGIKIVSYLILDPEAIPTPKDVSQVEKLLSTKSVDLAIITDDESTSNIALRDLALRYSVPILIIPSPTSPGDTLTKAETIITRLINVTGRDHRSESYYQQLSLIFLTVAIVVLVIALRSISRWK